MASNPLLYSPEELQKFAGDLIGDITDAPAVVPPACIDLDLTLTADAIQGAEIQQEGRSSHSSSDKHFDL